MVIDRHNLLLLEKDLEYISTFKCECENCDACWARRMAKRWLENNGDYNAAEGGYK